MCEIMTELNERAAKIALRRREFDLAAEMVKTGKLTETEITKYFTNLSPVEATQIYLENAPRP